MTREDIIRMAREAGATVIGNFVDHDCMSLERFAALVAAAEREECAKVAEARKHITTEWQLDQHYNQACSHCADAIRARGNYD